MLRAYKDYFGDVPSWFIEDEILHADLIIMTIQNSKRLTKWSLLKKECVGSDFLGDQRNCIWL